MYINKSDAEYLLRTKFWELLEFLRTKNHLIADHSDGDDWSFVIKTQTLIESAVTNAVLTKIGEDGLRKIFQNMPLVGDTVSKLSFSKDLGLTTSAQRRFITIMASLRNQLAHNPDYAAFTFDSYVLSLDTDRRKEWQQAIPWFAESPDSKKVWTQHTLKNPKSVIYIASFMLIGILELSAAEFSVLKKIDELSIATTTELLRSIAP